MRARPWARRRRVITLSTCGGDRGGRRVHDHPSGRRRAVRPTSRPVLRGRGELRPDGWAAVRRLERRRGAALASPLPTTFGGKEAWTVTCERPNGSIATVLSVIVDRGQTADLGFVCAREHKPHAG